MAQQLVTRIDDGLAADLDALVAAGVAATRSDAVRLALRRLVDAERRRRVGEAIVAGYERIPPTGDDAGWSDDATVRMIAEEPW